ncbi:phospholipase D-like domain-containing protein [Rhizomonospora bruguierae]|uniref:phospholipase D-like domain-containing protein n=1 Tax=Rhizomonospora bruguierae TaxID=1581705 RepID=UPI001BD07D39|nr:phospholipase D-like domain-containing protein [Micromonospora sp. NBRC 107566]
MTHRRLGRITAAAAAAALAAGLLVAAASTAGAATKPVINGATFNDPLGSAERQSAIFTQIIQLVDATPPGEQIRVSMFDFTDAAVADALLRAYRRGVQVRVIVDDSSYLDGNGRRKPSPAWDKLSNPTTGLGADDRAPSWIVMCDDQFEDDDGVDDVQRGCIATAPPGPAYNHNKFFLFSKVGPFDDGTSYQKVVLQTSSNLTDWYKVVSYNDAVTFVNATVHDGYAAYHEDLRRLRYSSTGDNAYYRSTPTGSTYRAFFFPRGDATYRNPATDTIVNALNEVACAYTGADGKRHQTDIRIVVLNFLSSRSQVATKLAELRGRGCWIDVIYAASDATVEGILDKAGIERLSCKFNVAPGIDVRPHSKFLLLDGYYNGDIEPRVYTGSPNLDGSSLRSSDQALLRISSAAYHASYLSYFYKIRAACRTGMAGFVRPGAVRVAATSPDPEVKASAFVSPAGRTTTNLLNMSASSVRVALRRVPASSDVYVTDEHRSLARVPVDGDLLLAPRSLTTVVSR